MPIQVTCSRCGTQYKVPDSHAGTMGKCRCGNQLPVPELPPPGTSHTGLPTVFAPPASRRAGPPADDDLVPLGPPRVGEPGPEFGTPGSAPPSRPAATVRYKGARGKREVIGGGFLIRAGSVLAGIVILIGIVYIAATYPRWVALRLDGDWRTPGGAVLTFRTGRFKANVGGKQTMVSGHFGYRAGKKWDDALLVPKELKSFGADGGMRFWLFPDGSLEMRVRYPEKGGEPKEVRLSGRSAGEGKMELSEDLGPSGSLILLKAPLIVTRVK